MKTPVIYAFFSLLVFSIVTSFTAHAYSIIPCTIQFPNSITTVPTTRVYHGGEIRTCTIDQDKKTITFNVTRYPQQMQFHVLCTGMIDFASYRSKYQPALSNTASHITLRKNQPYILFTLTLVPKKNSPGDYTWHIDTITDKDENNKIPDDAIIICLRPDWIHSMVGDNSFELPSVQIKSDICSEKDFYEQAVRLQLAAIDSDTLHSLSSQQIVRQEHNRIVIAAPTA